jgi:sporulation protein YqfD
MKKMNFKISVDYDDYFSNSLNLTATNIEVVGDAILFQTDKESIKYLDDNNIRYMLHYSKTGQVGYFLAHRGGIIIGLLFVFILVFLNSFRVNKINFNSVYPINGSVEEYIKSQNKELLMFSFHKNNYDYLSKELRSMYVEYEWINVWKKGTTIYVDIIASQEEKIDYKDDFSADIVAGKSGIINQYSVYNGEINIEVGKYVEKGEVLIKGDSTGVKCAKGFVLATTYDTITIDIKKEEIKKELTGINTKYYTLNIFGRSFNFFKKKEFIESEIKTKNIFTLPYLFSINKIEEYEKNDIIYTYDKEESLEYAKEIIRKDFDTNKRLDSESIVRLEVLSCTMDEDYYYVKLLVKKVESIGELKKHI